MLLGVITVTLEKVLDWVIFKLCYVKLLCCLQQTVFKDNFESVPAVSDSGTGDVDILVFDICLNSDSAVQGLGVKLKGKTASTPKEPKELGMFIKSVIAEGAAAKASQHF